MFNIDLSPAGSSMASTGYVRSRPPPACRSGGRYRAGTGSAAALSAASDPSAYVAAVVCRSGRPDLVGPRLCQVRAATLFIVGGLDDAALSLARTAQEGMRCPSELVVVPGAAGLFDEPGTLQSAAEHAAGWFNHHISIRQRG